MNGPMATMVNPNHGAAAAIAEAFEFHENVLYVIDLQLQFSSGRLTLSCSVSMPNIFAWLRPHYPEVMRRYDAAHSSDVGQEVGHGHLLSPPILPYVMTFALGRNWKEEVAYTKKFQSAATAINKRNGIEGINGAKVLMHLAPKTAWLKVPRPLPQAVNHVILAIAHTSAGRKNKPMEKTYIKGILIGNEVSFCLMCLIHMRI